MDTTTFIQEIKERLARSLDFKPVQPPPPESLRVRYNLEWRETPMPDGKETISLEWARYHLGMKMYNVCDSRRIPPMLICKAQPGIGKTYSAIATAQIMADQGKKVLYLMPTHAHYETIQQFPHFKPGHWYHWLGYNAPLPGGDKGEFMCKYAPQAGKWMQKGYPLMGMCDSLCSMYKTNCPYRQQSIIPNPIIAGVHEHAVTGLSISKFDLVIIDELPLRAFLSPRKIPTSGIATDNAVGPIAELQGILLKLAVKGGVWSGKKLMDKIHDCLSDVFAQFELDLLPAIPWLTTADDVDDAGYWYITDLLKLLVSEWKAYESGRESWLERVTIYNGDLILLLRGEAWKSLPKRVIVVDATANEAIYKQMFPEREIELYVPNVETKGSIRQVVHRYNGITTITGKQGPEMAALVAAIIKEKGYKNPAVITFKGAKKYFEDIVGADRVGHYYSQRGSNAFQDADALFVIGTPSPPDHMIMRDVAIINQDRFEPFATTKTDKGGIVPIRSVQLGWYPFWNEDGSQACRFVSGFRDNDLRAMSDAMREEELVQAVHRARPLLRECDIWLFSSIPIDVPLTAVYDSPEKVLDCPGKIHWQNWVKLRPWLMAQDDPFGIEDVSEAVGASINTVRQQKWLHAIYEKYPERFEISGLRPLIIDRIAG